MKILYFCKKFILPKRGYTLLRIVHLPSNNSNRKYSNRILRCIMGNNLRIF